MIGRRGEGVRLRRCARVGGRRVAARRRSVVRVGTRVPAASAAGGQAVAVASGSGAGFIAMPAPRPAPRPRSAITTGISFFKARRSSVWQVSVDHLLAVARLLRAGQLAAAAVGDARAPAMRS